MNTSISDLIKLAGGVYEISAASTATGQPVGPDAVHKWRKNGIPEVHWPIFIERAHVTVETLYRANEAVRRKKNNRQVNGAKRRSAVSVAA